MTDTIDLSGVFVATTLPFTSDADAPAGLAVDFEAFAKHCDWLIQNGCRGICPNGSLGEYSSLTDEERRRVVQVAVEAAAGRGLVIPGVHAVGWHQSQKWARWAEQDGADMVALLPPIVYRANEDELVEHYSRVAEAGLPVMIYNNPFDTKVDLTPTVLARLAEIPGVVAVKEFSGDVRRVLEIQERSDLHILAGADDLVFEGLVAGAEGWFAGYPNAFPRESVELFDLVKAGHVAEARELYAHLVAAFRWDSRTEFVQAIKLSVDLAAERLGGGGFGGGPTRPPRGPLSTEHDAQVREDMARALDYFAGRAAA